MRCECIMWWERALLAKDEARTPSSFASNYFAMWYLTCTQRDTNSSALPDSGSPEESVRRGQSTGPRPQRYLVCISVPPGFGGENDGGFVSRESAGRVVSDAIVKVRKLCQVIGKMFQPIGVNTIWSICRHTQHSSIMCSYCICASVPCPTSPALVFAPPA